MSKRMKGRAMLERASSLVARRSTSFLRELTCEERVPAEKRAMKSLSCAIFFLALQVVWLSMLGADAGLLQDHVVVAAVVGDDGLVVDVGDVGADGVEEVAVVRDGDDGAVVADEEVLEPVDGFEVEIVGGLVEEQGLGVAEEGLGEQDADLLAALQLGHFALVEFVGDVEALEEDGGVGFGFIAVFIADDAFELAEAGAVFVGHLGLVVDDFALFECGPEGFVAHDDGVDDAVGVELVLILLEDADFAGADDGCPSGRRSRR